MLSDEKGRYEDFYGNGIVKYSIGNKGCYLIYSTGSDGRFAAALLPY